MKSVLDLASSITSHAEHHQYEQNGMRRAQHPTFRKFRSPFTFTRNSYWGPLSVTKSQH